jgi:hypothetical protein
MKGMKSLIDKVLSIPGTSGRSHSGKNWERGHKWVRCYTGYKTSSRVYRDARLWKCARCNETIELSHEPFKYMLIWRYDKWFTCSEAMVAEVMES